MDTVLDSLVDAGAPPEELIIAIVTMIVKRMPPRDTKLFVI